MPIVRPIRPSAAALLLVLLTGCGDAAREEAAGSSLRPATGAATFVGRETCARCHPGETESWRGSHHDLAMQEATAETVRGDFGGATLTYAGTTSTFFRRDGRHFVRTDGPDGELRDYPVAYTFGVEPLQQYLIAFPGGRYQALSLVWDTRPATAGGQRWLHLYPGEAVDHRDPLHWTGVYQRWNPQCAECHSTNLQKGYDAAADRYATSWSEIDVSCEACHGPGSSHVEWAGKPEGERPGGGFGLAVDLRDRGGGGWEIDPGTGIAARTAPPSSRAEVETCGRCHARRSPIAAEYAPGRPLLDSHRLALLDEELYWADGFLRDEVYVYGSFLQSKMYRAGVTCSDCHDPHRLAISEPDAACARCHLRERFAGPAHHFHEPGSRGASCVECHMPARAYMVVDARREHAFRVPRPDLSLALGTPNACSDCHHDRGPEWVAAAFAERYGDVAARRPHFAAALDAGRRDLPGARRLLADLARDSAMPGIARGTALALYRKSPWIRDLDALRAGLDDGDPLVRLGAVRGAEALDPARRMELLAPLLDDPVRAVRIDAGRALADLPPERIGPQLRRPLDRALAEYVEAQQVNADRPEAQLNLGLLYAARGREADAERAYRRALELAPGFAPATVNLADLLRATGRDVEGETLLREAAARLPDDAGVRHSLGLLLVRRGRHAAALDELRRAAELAPDLPRYAYVYGVALHSRGDSDRALAVLAEAHRRHLGDPELLAALATLNRDAGRLGAAREYVAKLLALLPEDPAVRQLADELEGSGRLPGPRLHPDR